MIIIVIKGNHDVRDELGTNLYVSALIVQQSAKDPKTQHVVDKLFLLINSSVDYNGIHIALIR